MAEFHHSEITLRKVSPPNRLRPFAMLLTALRADCNGLGTTREATRRKIGIGGAKGRPGTAA
jgi:hypothetical protein